MTQVSNKKSLVIFALALSAVFLTGCQNDTESEPDITSGGEENTKFEISQSVTDIPIGEDDVTESGEEKNFIPKLLMDTDKPFVRAEDHYIIEKRDIDVSAFNKNGYTEFVGNGKFYYSCSAFSEDSGSKAEIYAYDLKSGERTTFYSEAPEGEGCWIDLDIKLIDGDFLYFYREAFQRPTENQSFQLLGRDLYRVNFQDNSAEKIFSYMGEEVMPTYPLTVSGDILFIPAVHDALNDYRFMIFQYDMNTGEASLFRDDADYPIPYNNGIVYYHDSGFYYHGAASDIKGRGVFYEGDELVFNSAYDGLHEDLVSDFGSDALIYVCADDTENFYGAGFDFGIFDKDFNRVLIAHTKKDTWAIQISDISTSGLISVGAPKPMIYDVNEECFAMISIDEYEYYISFAEDDNVCFFAYEYDSDYNYISAALYTVKRR